MTDCPEIKIVSLQWSDGSDAGYVVHIGGRAYTPEEARGVAARIVATVLAEDHRRMLADGTNRENRGGDPL